MGWGEKIYLLLQNGQVSIIVVVVVVVIIVVVEILFFENCSVLRSLSPKNTKQEEDKRNGHFCAT